jgi:hypothetical protein
MMPQDHIVRASSDCNRNHHGTFLVTTLVEMLALPDALMVRTEK